MVTIIGCDISLDHAGFCFLNEDGKVLDYQFYSQIKKEIAEDAEHGILLTVKKQDGEDPLQFQMRRLSEYLELFKDIGRHVVADCFSIEGYAYQTVTNSITQNSELMGMIKHHLYKNGFSFRIHDPLSVKFFAVGKGNATKDEMVEQAAKEGFVPNASFKMRKKKLKTGFVNEMDGPKTDVVDAYFLARLLWTELKLRTGELLLKDLPEYQVMVFNRVTKTYPVNILARSLIRIING